MLLLPPVHLSARQHPSDSHWELSLRYAAATAATLLAVAGAQLVTANSLIWLLAFLTITGQIVSLWLRLNNMKVGEYVIPRPLLNGLVVLASFLASIYLVLWPMGDSLLPFLNKTPPDLFWMRFGGGEPVQALMQLFLLFAAIRSFAIISDKDATLTTVPSFSVLLLLIPIHKGIEVVVYFVVWTCVAAILFALDHRAEARSGVSATVPALVAGQDVRLGARSLITILTVSLVSATGISLLLTMRDSNERSATEVAVSSLATRITNLMLAIPEVSTSSGPERQIDFKNGPSLPSRAPLWQVRVEDLSRRPYQTLPTYMRMFALSNYDGVSWKQTQNPLARVPRTSLNFTQWPLPLDFRRQLGLGQFDSRNTGYGPTFFPLTPRFGYDVKKRNPQLKRQFVGSNILVRQQLTSLVPNLGYVPVLPSVNTVRLEGEQKEIRVREDGAIDVGVVQINQALRILSEVPPLPEYGVSSRLVRNKKLTPTQIAKSGVALSARERAVNLRLPATLPTRVRQLSAQALNRIGPDASNWVKAQRLALEIQLDAVYTLRPPTLPEGRDATDFFLFDGSRRGYCTYFAGALTVLCRAQGIPARVVSGFGGLQWTGPDAGLIREGNAHAWTEVWVEGIGWAIVDATPPGDRGDNSPTWIESWADCVYSSLSNATIWISARKSFAATVGVSLLMLCGFNATRRKGLRGRTRQIKETQDDLERRAITQAYQSAARSMARKFRPKSAWETPDEWLQNCTPNLSKTDAESLRRLTALYLSARYGARPLPEGSAKLAKEAANSVMWNKIKRA